MRIIYMGSADFGLSTLQNIIDSSAHEVIAVYSQPPRKQNRGQKIIATPIQQLAENYNIPIHNPINFKDETEIKIFNQYKADIAVVAAYGLILPEAILTIPKFGCINIHGSILPKWRGAAPIQYSLLNGDEIAGVTIIQMAKGMDNGDMLAKKSIRINEFTKFSEIYPVLSKIGQELITQVLDAIENNTLNPESQEHHLASLSPKITKQDYELNLNQKAINVLRQIHALDYHGCKHKINQIEVKIFAAKYSQEEDKIKLSCEDGKSITPTILQVPGKNKITLQEFISGYCR